MLLNIMLLLHLVMHRLMFPQQLFPTIDANNEATETVVPIDATPVTPESDDAAPADDDPNIVAPPGGAPGAPVKT